MNDPDFFIVGPPRSGTSLLSVMVAQHPDVAIAQDTGIFHRWAGTVQALPMHSRDVNEPIHPAMLDHFKRLLWHFHGEMGNTPDPRKDRGIGDEYEELIKGLPLSKTPKWLFNHLIHEMIRIKGGKGTTIGEKTPGHLEFAASMAEVYPKAKFVTIVRNPIPWYGSRKQRYKKPVEDHAKFLNEMMERILPQSHVVKYEDVLAKPSTAVKRIQQFLGLPLKSLPDEFEPGVFQKYVGKWIDPKRDEANWAEVSAGEEAVLRKECKGIFEEYGYE